MKKTYQLYSWVAVIFLLHCSDLFAQRIRKNHREMAPSEKTAYLNAVIALRNNGTLTSLGNMHNMHFGTNIHSGTSNNGEHFMPWHRLFEIQMENSIRNSGVANASSVYIPYWDWRIENSNSNVTWDDPGFLQLSAINTSSYTITRSATLGSGAAVATSTDVANTFSITTVLPSPPSPGQKSSTVNRFSYRLEFWHDRGHVFIGGTMNSGQSPRDPAFFLHHAFVDKIWQEWFDSDNGIAKTLFTFSAPPTSGSSGYWSPWPSVSPNSLNDSRYLKYQNTPTSSVIDEEVWYAYNKKLVLDGIGGNPFNVTGTNRLYCYTAYNNTVSPAVVNGEIFAGDVKRDANNNIIADNRGGFKIKTSAKCTFSAGSAVNMLPGFEAEYGSVLNATVVSLPCGFSSLNKQASGDEIYNVDELESNENQLYVYVDGNNNLQVNYSTVASSTISFQILNMMGQVIHSVSMGKQAADVYQSTINLSDLPQGIYFCRMMTDNSQRVEKFVYIGNQ